MCTVVRILCLLNITWHKIALVCWCPDRHQTNKQTFRVNGFIEVHLKPILYLMISALRYNIVLTDDSWLIQLASLAICSVVERPTDSYPVEVPGPPQIAGCSLGIVEVLPPPVSTLAVLGAARGAVELRPDSRRVARGLQTAHRLTGRSIPNLVKTLLLLSAPRYTGEQRQENNYCTKSYAL